MIAHHDVPSRAGTNEKQAQHPLVKSELTLMRTTLFYHKLGNSAPFDLIRIASHYPGSPIMPPLDSRGEYQVVSAQLCVQVT
jgi:hypothetical protein